MLDSASGFFLKGKEIPVPIHLLIKPLVDSARGNGHCSLIVLLIRQNPRHSSTFPCVGSQVVVVAIATA